MELVPIVELTLSIFTGLLLLVIIISYISSKIKDNDRKNKTGLGSVVSNPASNFGISYAAAAAQPKYVETYSRNYIPSSDYTHPVQEEKMVTEDNNVQSSRPAKKFTVLNDMPPAQYGYLPETTKSFSHKFAPSKTKDAFAMFR